MPRRVDRSRIEAIIEQATQICKWYEENADTIYNALTWAKGIPEGANYVTRTKKYYKVSGDRSYIYEYLELCKIACSPYGATMRIRTDDPQAEPLRLAAEILRLAKKASDWVVNGLYMLQNIGLNCGRLHDAIILSKQYRNMR